MSGLAKAKTFLRAVAGERISGLVHAIRFAYLILIKRKTDPEMDYLRKILNKGDICIDVGANSADWTCYFSKVVGSRGHVYSFEADPYYAYATRMACHLLMLRNLSFYDFGLSDREEIVRLRIADKSGVLLSGTQTVMRGGENDPCEEGERTVRISLRRLDSMVADCPGLLRTRVVKIDVEGYELFVLKGAEGILRVAKPILILERGDFKVHGYTAGDLHAYLQSLGYVGYAINCDGGVEGVNGEMESACAIGSNRIYICR